MKKNVLIAIIASFTLFGCDKKNQADNKNEEDKTISLAGEYSKTIKFSGEDFSSYATAAGVQADHENYAANETKLKDYCASYLTYDGLLTSFTATKLNTGKWQEKTYLCIGTGYYVNSEFKSGSFKWESEINIYKVEIKVLNYAKENSYSGDIVDRESNLSIDDDLHSLALPSGNPVVKTFTKEYDKGTKSFELKSTGGRVLVEELTITWNN